MLGSSSRHGVIELCHLAMVRTNKEKELEEEEE
jgi:hypothetical protein